MHEQQNKAAFHDRFRDGHGIYPEEIVPAQSNPPSTKTTKILDVPVHARVDRKKNGSD
jgi:hypothetical protein